MFLIALDLPTEVTAALCVASLSEWRVQVEALGLVKRKKNWGWAPAPILPQTYEAALPTWPRSLRGDPRLWASLQGRDMVCTCENE